MYAEFGEQEKSKAIVKSMVDTVFSHFDDGFPGDEDNGTMACWYVFATLGFYPTCPGKLDYTVSGSLLCGAKLVADGKEIDLNERIKGKLKVNHFDLIK